MSARPALLVALLLFVAARALHAEPRSDSVRRSEEHRYELRLPAGAEELSPGAALLAISTPAGARMSLSRLSHDNLPAYWRDDKERFLAEVERGLARSTPGYHLRSKKEQRIESVPALDLHFRREVEGRVEEVWMRFLFYRRYALVASAASPARGARKARQEARAFARSLEPWAPPEADAGE